MTFEPATNTGPVTIYTSSTPNDPREVLPAAAVRKFTPLSQRSIDTRAAVPDFSVLQEAAKLQTERQNRIDHLLRRRPDGGMGQDETSPSVLDERRKLERATSERLRLQELSDIRSARSSACRRLEVDIADWVMRGGVPGGCVLEAVEDDPIQSILKKGERIVDAVDRCRHSLRELAADRHRIRSSPWPSSEAKLRARQMIEQMAEAGTPNFDSMIEHNSPLSFPTRTLQSSLIGLDTPTMTFTETVDAVSVMCWLWRSEMLAKINKGIDEVADDKAALDGRQRAEAEAQINTDVLMVERSECSLIWHAEAQGEVIDFRPDTSALAVLGCRLVTAPAVTPGSSPSMAFDIIGNVGRR